MALSKGDINLEDAIDIREHKNLKLANQLLKLKRTQKARKARADDVAEASYGNRETALSHSRWRQV